MHFEGDPHLDNQRRAREGAAVVLHGVALNAVLATVKIAGGVWGNTYALIADGAESIVDIVSSSVVWTGLRVASRPPDEKHPYGHGKAEPLAAFIVALLVLTVAGWVAWQAVLEIAEPHAGPHWGTLPLLAGIVAAKFVFSRRLLRAGRDAGSSAVHVEAWHHYVDALTSAAAFVGISIAVIGGEGYEAADDWAAIAAALVIAWNGVSFLRASLDDMMDAAVKPALENDVRALAGTVRGVRGIDKCRIRKSGLSHLVDIHVEVAGDLSVRAGHDIAGAVKHILLRSELRISDVSVHVEPAAEP